VFADVTLQPALEQREQRTKTPSSSLHPLPAVLPGAGDVPSSAAAVGDDELYGSLDLSMEPAIPQTDGAADSPPHRARGRGANPAERWEMGGGNDMSGGFSCKANGEVGRMTCLGPQYLLALCASAVTHDNGHGRERSRERAKRKHRDKRLRDKHSRWALGFVVKGCIAH
jgi:hypothetical protein